MGEFYHLVPPGVQLHFLSCEHEDLAEPGLRFFLVNFAHRFQTQGKGGFHEAPREVNCLASDR